MGLPSGNRCLDVPESRTARLLRLTTSARLKNLPCAIFRGDILANSSVVPTSVAKRCRSPRRTSFLEARSGTIVALPCNICEIPRKSLRVSPTFEAAVKSAFFFSIVHRTSTGEKRAGSAASVWAGAEGWQTLHATSEANHIRASLLQGRHRKARSESMYIGDPCFPLRSLATNWAD